jgi:hypothetical protein
MILIPTVALLVLAVPPEKPRPHLSSAQLVNLGKRLARDEGWPIDQKGYTLDPMKPDIDDGFDSIGVYRKAHLVRMYSIDRTTGDIVDFMRGCNVFDFEDIKDIQEQVRKISGATSLPTKKLAAKVGCKTLAPIRNRWVQ